MADKLEILLETAGTVPGLRPQYGLSMEPRYRKGKLQTGFMKEETRKKIEAKWHQLITESDKVEKPKSPAKSSLIGVKVIRRRKGQTDMPIS